MEKIKRGARILHNAFYRGLASADAIMEAPADSIDGIEVVAQQHNKSGALQNLLDQEVTQEVEELRDKYYRVFHESGNYDTSQITMAIDENGLPVFGNLNSVKKRDKKDFMHHPPVYGEDVLPLVTLQDNKSIMKGSNFSVDLTANNTDYETTISIDWGDIIPRFRLEKYVKRIAVRHGADASHALVDLYLSYDASQFGKVDAILISNLHKMMETKDYRADFVHFKSISWLSDKAWNCDDLHVFEYDNPKLMDMVIFDGSFVLVFDCHVIKENFDATSKYKTASLDEKYANNAPKNDTTDLFAIERNMKKVSGQKTEPIVLEADKLQPTVIKLY